MKSSPRWQSIAGGAQEDTALQEKIDHLHATVFGTDEGKDLLAYLRSITIERRDPVQATDGALRESEACRRFVANLEMRIARHWTRAMQPKDKDGTA